MSKISYPCRACGTNTLHEVVSHDHTRQAHNEAVLECTKCDTPKFAVIYDKEATAPNALSKRASEVLCEDEQPTDIC